MGKNEEKWGNMGRNGEKCGKMGKNEKMWKNGEKCGKMEKNEEKFGKIGKMRKNEEKPETGSRQGKERAGKERQQGTPSRNRKPETRNRKFWFLDSKPESGFDSGLDLVRNGLRVTTGFWRKIDRKKSETCSKNWKKKKGKERHSQNIFLQ